MLKEFKEFLLKTNALALAVGVIIGAAVGKVVSSLVSDILMPVIGLLVPGGAWREAAIVLTTQARRHRGGADHLRRVHRQRHRLRDHRPGGVPHHEGAAEARPGAARAAGQGVPVLQGDGPGGRDQVPGLRERGVASRGHTNLRTPGSTRAGRPISWPP